MKFSACTLQTGIMGKLMYKLGGVQHYLFMNDVVS